MRRAKVLWLSHLVPVPPIGGVRQRSFNLIKQLARHHDVSFLGFNQRAFLDTDEAVREAVRQLGSVCRVLGVVSIPSDRRRYGRHLLALRSAAGRVAYTLNWLESDQMRRRLADVLAEERFDIVHFDTISLAPYRALVRSGATVLNHHNVESHMMRRRVNQEPNWLRRAYFSLEAPKLEAHERAFCPMFDLHLTCSRLDAERLLAVVPGISIEEIPNGVDLDFFPLAESPVQADSLVFAGRMDAYPNRDAMRFFTEAVWPRLKQVRPGIRMTIVGSHPSDSLRRLAETDSALEVTGFVPDARPYLARATVYVCPIRDGGGTKLKVLDALAMGKAMVAHPIALEGIDVRPEEHLLTAETPEEFVGQILRLLGDATLRDRIGRAGRARIEERYDFERIGARLAEIYADLVHGNSGHRNDRAVWPAPIVESSQRSGTRHRESDGRHFLLH